MGLFDKLRKKDKINKADFEAADSAPVSAKTRWDEAWQAKPQAYEDPDGVPFICFTLTENTDTILPMDPKRMYQMDGKEVEDFRLGFVSLTEDTVLCQLPFYSCIHALSEYALEVREPYVLVRNLDLQEMKKLIAEVQADIISRQELRSMFEKNLEFIGLDHTSKDVVKRVFHGEGTQTFTFEDVRFPSGILIAADPICYLQDPKSISYLKKELPAGTYPITIGIYRSEKIGVRITGMKLQICQEEAVEYKLADSYHMEQSIRKDSFAGFPVETGTATFCDKTAAESYWQFLSMWYKEHPKGNFYDDYLAELFQESYEAFPDLQREGGDFIRFRIPGTEQEIIMAATGFGDGFYSVFWGYNISGEPVELVTMFVDPALLSSKEL